MIVNFNQVFSSYHIIKSQLIGLNPIWNIKLQFSPDTIFNFFFFFSFEINKHVLTEHLQAQQYDWQRYIKTWSLPQGIYIKV